MYKVCLRAMFFIAFLLSFTSLVHAETVYVGDPLELECEFSQQHELFEFGKNKDKTFKWNTPAGLVEGEDYELQESEFTATLVIKNLEPKYQGNYSCELYIPSSKLNIKELTTSQVLVVQKPTITFSFENEVWVEGEPMISLCNVTGLHTSAELSISYDGQETKETIPASTQTENLTYKKSITRDDSGKEAVCSLTYDGRNVKEALIVSDTVYYKPSKPEITHEDSDDSFVLFKTCSSDGRPEPAIVWQFNGEEVSNSSTLQVGITAEEGDYTCIATNEYGSVETAVLITPPTTTTEPTTTTTITTTTEAPTTTTADTKETTTILITEPASESESPADETDEEPVDEQAPEPESTADEQPAEPKLPASQDDVVDDDDMSEDEKRKSDSAEEMATAAPPSDNSTVVIVGVVICVAALVIIGGLYYCCRRNTQRRRPLSTTEDAEASTPEKEPL